jgi:hypothetical protein
MSRRLATVALALSIPACGGGGSPAAPAGPPAPGGTAVGAAGGTVTAGEGAIRLVIPAGALSAPVAFTIRPAASVPVDPLAVPGSAWDLTPPVPFTTPASLTVRYDPARVPAGVDETELRLFGVGAGNAWAPVGQSTVDAAANEASAPITRTATFGVRAAR